MVYTQIKEDAFKQLQLNAGILLTSFNPSDGTVTNSSIIGATSGGVTFNSNVSYVDYGDDIDNVPANTMQLKRIESYDPALSGTFKTVDNALGKMLLAHAEQSLTSGLYTFTPRIEIYSETSGSVEKDFSDIWWVGDYSNVNTGSSAGFIAIKLMNALNTASFQLKSSDDGKGEFSFEFHGHYDLNDIDTIPFMVYMRSGTTATTA